MIAEEDFGGTLRSALGTRCSTRAGGALVARFDARALFHSPPAWRRSTAPMIPPVANFGSGFGLSGGAGGGSVTRLRGLEIRMSKSLELAAPGAWTKVTWVPYNSDSFAHKNGFSGEFALFCAFFLNNCALCFNFGGRRWGEGADLHSAGMSCWSIPKAVAVGIVA